MLAFDEASARKKVERALAAGRKVATDVEGTGAVWTYATTRKATGDAKGPISGALLGAGHGPSGR